MIRPSTAMVLAAFSLLIPAGVVADANVAQGAGVNVDLAGAKDLLSRAVPLNGAYQIVSKSTGRALTYLHDKQPNMYPADGTVDRILDSLSSSVEHPVASQTLTLSAFDDNTVRIRFDDADKCLSAQWNFDWGIDTYGVAYTCGVGPGATSDTGIRDAKQQYLAIPVHKSVSGSATASGGGEVPQGGEWDGAPQSDDGWSGNDNTGSGSAPASSGSSDSDDSSDDSSSGSSGSGSGTACEKDPEWVWRHPIDSLPDYYRVHPECVGTEQAPPCLHDNTWLHEHSGYMADHPECDDVYAGKKDTTDDKYTSRERSLRPAAAHRRRRLAKQEKRGSSIDVYLVLLDHLEDMLPRAVSAKQTTAFADAKGAWIDLFDEDDADLIWTLTEA